MTAYRKQSYQTESPTSSRFTKPSSECFPGENAAPKDEIQEILQKIKLLESRVHELLSSQIDLPFASRVKYRERLDREEFFYKAFRALAFNQIAGDYVEFGSHGGTTFCFAYHQAKLHRHKARLWAFDSFQGFPEQSVAEDQHPKWIKGKMSTSLEDFHNICTSRGVPRDAYTVVPGFFSEVLPKISANEGPTDIAFVYVDCDLYSSTKDVLEFLQPRLKHGMILAFDDFYCWSETQAAGERIAMLEVFAQSDDWELVPYLQFGWHGLAFVVHKKRSE